MFNESEDIEMIGDINRSAKDLILNTLDDTSKEIDTKTIWNRDECLNLAQIYFDLMNSINTYAGISKNHQENEGLVHFDFDPTNLIKINNFIKQSVIPEFEKNLNNPNLKMTERKQLEKFLKQLNDALIFGEIYATGSFKQNASR